MTPPIKVCHLITDLEAGGAERNLVNVVTHADSSRIVSEVISLLDPGIMAAELTAAGIPVTSLGMRRGRPSLAGLVSLVRHLRRSTPTILVTWLYHADLLGYLASRFTPSTRLVWNLRCSDIARAPDQRALRLLLRLLASLSPKPDVVVVNSVRGRHFHQEMGYKPRQWMHVANGVDTERFRPRPTEKARLRVRLGLPADARVIGLVARLHPMKDHETFLRAAALFSEHDQDARFVLCGSGCRPDSDILRPLIEGLGLAGRVMLLGERTDLDIIYPAFDVLTQSSAYGEGLPNVVIEAMACGVPCVVTDVGDSRDVVGETGLVLPPRDPQALARGWEKVLSERPGTLGENARLRILERYSIERACMDYEALYERLAWGDPVEDQSALRRSAR
jgi:glycosyltransferase involved in cell wall biosynthesis